MMMGATLRTLLLLVLTVAARAAAPTEPLVGTWTLSSQIVDGKKIDSDPLTLRIYPSGSALEFAYSMPVNGIHLVSMKFASVRLDGSQGAIEDVQGRKMGSVKVTKVAPLEYKAVIEGTNRPKAIGLLSISADGKTLTSQSDSSSPGKPGSHAVQVFNRH